MITSSGAPSWANIASQAPQRFGMDSFQVIPCNRGGRLVDQRNTQVYTFAQILNLLHPNFNYIKIAENGTPSS